MADPRARIADNPFYVLAVGVEAPRAEVEREGQKWLAMLDLGMAAAKTYASPFGPRERTPDKVRQALAELREPERRLAHELWATLPAAPVAVPPVAAAAPGWPDAMAAMGFAARKA